MFKSTKLFDIPPQEAPSIARLHDVGLRYGNGPEILKDIDLNLQRGSFHFLTGPSGAGKTSLLRMLYLAYQPTRGQVKLFSHPVHYENRDQTSMIRRKIGVVFQDYQLLDHLTVFDNVALPLRIAGKSKASIEKNVYSLLHWVGLGNYLHAKPPVLSGGQKQRVAIARAIINKPDLLLADEPTGNVDAEMARRLMHLFIELNKLGTTIVVATHNMDLVNQFLFPRLHLDQGYLSVFKTGEGFGNV